MNTKIVLRIAETIYKEKEVEVVKTAYLPIWAINRSTCDICGFHLKENVSEDSTLIVLKTKSNGNLYIHPECLNRAKRKDV